MKEGLLQLLGDELYSELAVDQMSDKSALINTLKTNISEYSSKLEKAQKKFEQDLKQAVKLTRERYREKDEQLKLTLKSIKNSGLGKIGMDWIVDEISSTQLMPQIGTSFDP